MALANSGFATPLPTSLAHVCLERFECKYNLPYGSAMSEKMGLSGSLGLNCTAAALNPDID
ncbi:hypothetical protein HG264_00860 [Pseudomonas sp. gcc21]|uniref:hypothetical protein n=1 Tax=Pseudomonas sp. gcc21 TaxID=2726989 RepID=UPI0014516229|nr:hypothetical protein [Pseudomonas sp. gcc21]QJD57560.1 hypothetical protein HG264_00860 [Pseudomonas sp. gcc21]